MTDHEIYHRLTRVSLDAAALRAQLVDRDPPCPTTVQGLRLRLQGDLEALADVLRPGREGDASTDPTTAEASP